MANQRNGGIQWTDETWNPIVGRSCSETALVESAIAAPLHWRKPRRIVVCSMSDLFHPSTPFEWIDRVFGVMALCPQHTFQILTKRPERMAEYLNYRPRSQRIWDAQGAMGAEPHRRAGSLPLPNVWLGTSVENQEQADKRIPHLLECPAAVLFLSCEPLLGAIELTGDGTEYLPDEYCSPSDPQNRINWVIAGGESGPNARPMHPEWARSLRDQCQAAGVPFFMKQWGEWHPGPGVIATASDDMDVSEPVCAACGRTGTSHSESCPGYSVWMYRVGKARAGRLLDGVEHNGMPKEWK